MLEERGVDTPDGHVQPSKGLLKPTTVNRWLRTFEYDHGRLTRAPPAVRFEAGASNELWQFDMSPSDLKKLPPPGWIEPGKGGGDAGALQRGRRSERYAFGQCMIQDLE